MCYLLWFAVTGTLCRLTEFLLEMTNHPDYIRYEKLSYFGIGLSFGILFTTRGEESIVELEMQKSIDYVADIRVGCAFARAPE
jgi:hypothetical protein